MNVHIEISEYLFNSFRFIVYDTNYCKASFEVEIIVIYAGTTTPQFPLHKNPLPGCFIEIKIEPFIVVEADSLP